jgi:hypothetical protein
MQIWESFLILGLLSQNFPPSNIKCNIIILFSLNIMKLLWYHKIALKIASLSTLINFINVLFSINLIQKEYSRKFIICHWINFVWANLIMYLLFSVIEKSFVLKKYDPNSVFAPNSGSSFTNLYLIQIFKISRNLNSKSSNSQFNQENFSLTDN